MSTYPNNIRQPDNEPSIYHSKLFIFCILYAYTKGRENIPMSITISYMHMYKLKLCSIRSKSIQTQN